jgi:hypothetical protein
MMNYAIIRSKKMRAPLELKKTLNLPKIQIPLRV